MRVRTMAGAAGLILLGYVGGVATASPATPAAEPTAQPPRATATATAVRAAATATAPAEPYVVELSGRGERVADVRLRRGLARITLTHDGRRNYAVELLTPDGRRAQSARAASETLLVNAIGAYEGEKAVRIETAGDFVLNVSADGNWSIRIQQ